MTQTAGGAVPGGRPHRVVIVGGGFGGLRCAGALKSAPVEIVMIDRRNFHLFQPLLYQVATGGLSPGEIAVPLRRILRRQKNARVVLGEVTAIDLAQRTVHVRPPEEVDADAHEVSYDTLVVATGARHAYFGHDEWEPLAPGLKTLEDALEIRSRVLLAFEAAEIEPDPARRQAWLTFVVVGAGPTGVELAGQVAEIAHDALRGDFRSADPSTSRVLLVEGEDRVLTAFDPRLSAKAERSLERLGVTVVEGARVVGIAPDAVTVQRAGDGGQEHIPARTVIWAAGVAASPLARSLGEQTGAEVDRSGRVAVEPGLTLPGHPEVFVIGDMATLPGPDGRPLPGVAPVAMQQGVHVGRSIRRTLGRGGQSPPFRYKDKGNLATIGRAAAVAEIAGLRLSGLVAWVTWLAVHIMYLIGFQNRLLVMTRWLFSYLTHGRGARLISGRDAGIAPRPDRPPPG